MNSNFDQSLSVQVFKEGQPLCQQSYIDCSSYHFVRPILRRIASVPSPFSHQDFYTTAIAEAVDGISEAKVTISGTADYSWLLSDSPLLDALDRKGIQAQITVVDGCSTPTSFSRIAGGETPQHTVSTSTQNITQFLAEEKTSDLIVTDAFLTQFADRQDRLAILSRWRQALKIGGYVVTTAQINTAGSIEKSHATNRFIENTVSLYEQSAYPEILQLDSKAFRERVQAYSSPNASRIYESEEELITEIEESGLKIENLTPMSMYSNSSEKTLRYCGIVLKSCS